jgi:sirohydrochlorin cobaltochelatase
MRLTPPIGTHPGIERIAAERAVGLAADHGFALGETTLLVVGHGTKRHAKSRGATLNLASVLDRRLDVLESIACFLDDDPSIENARRTARGKNIIAISFLLADGPHAKRDVPGGLSIPTSECVGPPCHARVEGKYVVCDAPIGTDAGITPLVVEMATKSWLHKEVV